MGSLSGEVQYPHDDTGMERRQQRRTSLSLVTKDHRMRGLVGGFCYRYANFSTSYFGLGSGWGYWRILAGLSHKVILETTSGKGIVVQPTGK